MARLAPLRKKDPSERDNDPERLVVALKWDKLEEKPPERRQVSNTKGKPVKR